MRQIAKGSRQKKNVLFTVRLTVRGGGQLALAVSMTVKYPLFTPRPRLPVDA